MRGRAYSVRRGAAFLVALWGATLEAPAAAQECRLALVLALDVSSSVDAAEDRLQREGLARALVAPGVVKAFLAADPVALYAFGTTWSATCKPSGATPAYCSLRTFIGPDL